MGHARRVEDRIRILCAKASISDGQELHKILAELRASIHQHANQVRMFAASALLAPGSKHDKRNRHQSPTGRV
jgi:hypothetical protein